MISSLLLTIVGTAAGSALATRWSIPRLKRHGIVDVPNERSSHASPTVRGAGLAMAATWGVAAIVIAAVQPHSPSPLLGLVGLAMGLSLVGFWDDLRSVGAGTRLAAQAMICLAAVILGLRTDTLAASGVAVVPLGAFAIPLCTVGLLTMVNLFNFMDGIDGLAAGQTLVAGVVIIVGALLVHADTTALLAAALAGVAGGFLPFNWSPARCFMGDSGSYFCGGALGGLLIFGQRSGVPLLLVGLASVPFLADAAITLIRRLAARQRVWQAHRSHLYQRMVARGWPHAWVAGLYMSVAAVIGVAALALIGFHASPAG